METDGDYGKIRVMSNCPNCSKGVIMIKSGIPARHPGDSYILRGSAVRDDVLESIEGMETLCPDCGLRFRVVVEEEKIVVKRRVLKRI